MILKYMNKILLFYISAILSVVSINLNVYGEDEYFYIPGSRLHSLKELAINGDRDAAYKLARYYDFYSNDSDSVYKASIWYYISGLLGQKNGYWKAFERLNEVLPIKNSNKGSLANFSDFLKFYPKEKFNIEGSSSKLAHLLTFLYCDKYSNNDKKYEISKKYLLDNKVNLELFSDKNYKRYLHDDFYILPDEIHVMEKLALRGNRRVALELLNYANFYPSSYNKYSFLWDYIYNVILSDGRENIGSIFPQDIRVKRGIDKADDIFLILFRSAIEDSNKTMLSNYILYKYYYIIGNNEMVKKYKRILDLDKIDSKLLMHHKYSN